MTEKFTVKDKEAEKKNSVSFSFPDFSLERRFYKDKKDSILIAGIDEAGRGALAGPLSVAIVLYPPEYFFSPPGDIFNIINDSKRLSPEKRKKAALFIKDHAFYSDTVFIPQEDIDRLNVNEATRLAVVRLVERAAVKPGLLLIDGGFKFDLPLDYIPVKRGDSLSASIASASIIAKVKRDQFMNEIDSIYPDYGFKKNMGYGTRVHLEAVFRKGPSPIHRRTYEPIRSILKKSVIS